MNRKHAVATTCKLFVLLGLWQPIGAEAAERLITQQAAAEVDRLLGEEVFKGVESPKLAPRTGDEIFLRRVYLDLIGRLPSASEITLFVLDPSKDKRAAVVARLLTDPRYGTNWARYWRDVIMYRRSADQVLMIAGQLEPYLTEQFNRNVGWNQIAAAFVTAKGNTSEHGETALFVAQLANPVDVAAETSRIFMGVQIQCAQCHDHPSDRWKREQFHELAAFFPRTGFQRVPGAGGRPSITIASFDSGPLYRRPGMFGPGAQEHFMPDLKNPAGQGKLMAPAFFATGDRLETGSTDGERRQSLARWMASNKNPWFAKALVNRLWAELVGEGFYDPIDDLGADKPCSAPRTLDYLAGEFVASGYDLKRLLRTILDTQAYERESRPRHAPGEPPFAANVPQPLRTEQLFDALTSALGSDFAGRGRANLLQNMPYNAGPRGQWNQLFGFDPSLRRADVSSTIPQALMLMNSPMISQRMRAQQPDTYLGDLVASTLADDDVTVELYLRTLAREPNPKELAVCREHVKAASSRAAAFEDIFWALLNSEEFRTRN